MIDTNSLRRSARGALAALALLGAGALVHQQATPARAMDGIDGLTDGCGLLPGDAYGLGTACDPVVFPAPLMPSTDPHPRPPYWEMPRYDDPPVSIPDPITDPAYHY